jgi:hypothetical protein
VLTTRAVHTQANLTEEGGAESRHHAVDARESDPQCVARGDLAKDDEPSAIATHEE